MVDERIREYYTRKKLKEQGKVIGAPVYQSFPKLGRFLPEIPKGTMVMITANSGIGKSQFYKCLFIWAMWAYYKRNPKADFVPQWIIFLLEESKEEFMDTLVCAMLFLKYNIVIDPLSLNSMHESPVNEHVLKKIEECKDLLNELSEHMVIEDSVYNPTGIYKICRTYSRKWGTHYYRPLIGKEEKFITFDEYIKLDELERTNWKYSHYQANDPRQHVFLITDHLALMQPEGRRDLRETMGLWSYDYCRKQISKHWKWTVCNVVQQASDSEKQQFDYKGKSIISKIKPSLDGLGDNKAIQRDHLVIFGIFAPDRYQIDYYEGYDVKQMKDKFRTLLILKNRIGRTNLELPLYFNGSSSYFAELPASEQMTADIYDKINKSTFKQPF